MKKIITLFRRDPNSGIVRDEVQPGAEWVIKGKGTATKKWDGLPCLFRHGKMYKRYEVAPDRQPPEDFLPSGEEDDDTGKQQGWVPVGSGPEDKWYRDALEFYRQAFGEMPEDGTYELCGPGVRGNPENLDVHLLLPHGAELLINVPTTYNELKKWLSTRDMEGIIWWRDSSDPDCDKVKITKKDFGLPRKPAHQPGE